MSEKNILEPHKHKKNKEIERSIISKVKNFMVYQYNEKEDFKDGYWGEIVYEDSKAIDSPLIEVIASELVSSSKAGRKKEIISNVFDIIRDYLTATNYIREQKYLKVEVRHLRFFNPREVNVFSQAYTMFYYIQFQEFCEVYFKSKLISPTFEKILIYDLACCEYSSFLDALSLPGWIQVNARNKKYSPIFLHYTYFAKKIIVELFNAYVFYLIISFLFDIKDLAMLCVVLVFVFKNKNISTITNQAGGLVPLYYYLQKAELKIQSQHVLRIAARAIDRSVNFPHIMFHIIDRAIENKHW